MNEKLFNKQLGARLKTLRKLNNLNQEDIGRKLNCTFQQIQKYENGINRISAYKLTILSELYKVSLDDMFNNYVETVNFKKNKLDEIMNIVRKL